MQVTFYIHKGTRNYVYISCYTDDGRVRKSIAPYPLAPDTFPEGAPKAIKNKINSISLRCDRYVSNCKNGLIPITKKAIKEIIDLELHGEVKQKYPLVSQLINHYKTHIKKGLPVNEVVLSKDKLKSVVSAMNAFNNSGIDCPINTFDFNKWTDYLLAYKTKSKKPISKSTVIHRQLIVKQAIEFTYKKLHDVKTDIKIASFEDVDNPCYYSIPELLKLYNLSLKGIEETARDILVYGAFIGFRRADYLKHDSNYIEDGRVSMITSKRKVAAAIPLSGVCDEILKKYGGEPPKLDSHTFHRYIKKVCKGAGFTEPLTFVRTVGGKKTTITKPKYELTSWHTMRRSCATNMLNGCKELGIPPIEAEAVRKMMGWKTDKMVRKYNKATAEDVARQKTDHPLFKVGA